MGKSIIIALIAGTMGVSILALSSTQTLFHSEEEVATHQKELLVREIAHSGANMAMSRLERDYSWREGFNDAKYQGGTFDVALTDMSGGRVALVTEARALDVTYTIRSVVSAQLMPAALIADVDGAIVDYSGNNFRISGIDTEPTGLAGPGPNVHGVAATQTHVKEEFGDALNNPQKNNVYGVGGDEDIVDYNSWLDIDELYNHAVANADFQYEGNYMFTGNDTFGTPDAPINMVINGDADFAGTVQGYGVLVVNGELQIAAGNFTWEGLVIVNSESDVMVTHTADMTGNATIYGSLILRQRTLNQDGMVGFAIAGAAAVYYSSTAIKRLFPIAPALNTNMRLALLEQWEG